MGSNTILDESYSVFLCVAMTTAFIFQMLAFFTPYWACREAYDDSDANVTDLNCTSEGLFFTCTDSGECQPRILDNAVFGLCLTCFLLNLLTVPGTLFLFFKQIKRKGRINMKLKLSLNRESPKKNLFYVFVIGQLLPPIAFIILRTTRVDGTWSDDWSSYLFLIPSLVFAVPVYFVISVIAAFIGIIVIVLVAYCLIKMRSKDRY